VSNASRILDTIIAECFRSPEDLDVLTRFDAAFRPYAVAVLAAMAPPDPSLVQDAYQSSFIKYIQIFREGPRPKVQYPAYFITIAKNALIGEIRRQKGHIQLDELLPTSALSDNAAEASRTELRTELLQAMERLNRRCQFLIESHYIKGAPLPTLAERLHIEVGSVRTALHRCLDALRRILR
jgi:RNA polymerase sigma factor (sigma-70 family)